jgi:hypothetical protein
MILIGAAGDIGTADPGSSATIEVPVIGSARGTTPTAETGMTSDGETVGKAGVIAGGGRSETAASPGRVMM